MVRTRATLGAAAAAFKADPVCQAPRRGARCLATWAARRHLKVRGCAQEVTMRHSTQGRAAILAITTGAALALAGCTHTQLVDVWQDPDAHPERIRSILVVSQRPDPTE